MPAYSAVRNSSGRGLLIPDKTVPGTIDFSDCELWNKEFEIALGTGSTTSSGTNSSHRPALAVALPVVQWLMRLQVGHCAAFVWTLSGIAVLL